jgi:hypothetical protein
MSAAFPADGIHVFNRTTGGALINRGRPAGEPLSAAKSAPSDASEA